MPVLCPVTDTEFQLIHESYSRATKNIWWDVRSVPKGKSFISYMSQSFLGKPISILNLQISCYWDMEFLHLRMCSRYHFRFFFVSFKSDASFVGYINRSINIKSCDIMVSISAPVRVKFWVYQKPIMIKSCFFTLLSICSEKIRK